MPRRRIFIVAGPPGCGKSPFFALSDFADQVFNADDGGAKLNSGSDENIPTAVRAAVNLEFEEFVPLKYPCWHVFRAGDDSAEHHYVGASKHCGENGFRVSTFYGPLAIVLRTGAEAIQAELV